MSSLNEQPIDTLVSQPMPTMLNESNTQEPTSNEQLQTTAPTSESSSPDRPTMNAVPDSDRIEGDNSPSTTDCSNSCSYNPSGPVRVPGTYPPEWLPDPETDACMACDTQFTLIKRRHHCRSCGKIFCGDCCKLKARLLYLDNKEARVCANCHYLIECTLVNSLDNHSPNNFSANDTQQDHQVPSSTGGNSITPTEVKVQGVLKTSSSSRNFNSPNASTSSSSESQNKQVMFSDGIRPGTDLSEPFPFPVSSPASSTSSPAGTRFPTLTRQRKNQAPPVPQQASKNNMRRSKSAMSFDGHQTNIVVWDELGYLPPIVIGKNSAILKMKNDQPQQSSNPLNSLTSLIMNQFKSTPSSEAKILQTSIESRCSPLNNVMKFQDIAKLVGSDGVVTFILLRDFHLKVKIVTKECCIDQNFTSIDKTDTSDIIENDPSLLSDSKITDLSEPTVELVNKSILPEYWCFASDGLAKFGQDEIVLIIDKDQLHSNIPRDVFKIYLTLHELSLRRQSLDHLGNLLFQDGLFDNRDTAGLLFVRPMPQIHCLKNLVLPEKPFLIALVLQRWEVPWSKVFPVRLLLRLGHKYNVYPHTIISFRARDPVYYEVGHTIISILGDFRNFRYSITHVEGLKVMLMKSSRKILVQLSQSSYQQFNKVLSASNNEHVLAWSSYPFAEADGHLVSVQNEEGQYETVEFYKKSCYPNFSFDSLQSCDVLGSSFIIFSGALKVNQSGQPAKISVVEDGLLVQIQSCTMSALKNAIHYMHHFDIDCETDHDAYNRVEIVWEE